MCRFESSDVHLRMKATFDFGRIGTLEKQLDGFFEVGRGRLDRVALAGHIKLGTERDIARPFLLDNRCIAFRCHDYPTPPCPTIESSFIIVESGGEA